MKRWFIINTLNNINKINNILVWLRDIEYNLSNSRYKILRKNSKTIIDLVLLQIITYIIMAFIYSVGSVTPQVFSSISQIVSGMEALLRLQPYTLKLLLISEIDFNIRTMVFIYILVNICLWTWYFIGRKNTQDFFVLKEINVLISFLRNMSLNINIRLKDMYIFTVFFSLTIAVTFVFVGINIFLKYFKSILGFWIGMFIVILVYGGFDNEEINAKKSMCFIIIVPIIIVNMIMTSSDSSNISLNLLFFIASFFLTVDYLASQYINFRNELFKGRDILYVIDAFTEEDHTNLYNEMNLNFNNLKTNQEINLLGIVSFNKKEPDIELAKKCFEKSLDKDTDDYLAMYYLGSIYVVQDYNKQDRALELLNQYKESSHNDKINFSDTEYLIALCLFNTSDPDYVHIIELLKNSPLQSKDVNYLLARSYMELREYEKAENLLHTICYSEDYYRDTPYWLTIIELNKKNPDTVLVKRYIEKAEELKNDCSDLRYYLCKLKEKEQYND